MEGQQLNATISAQSLLRTLEDFRQIVLRAETDGGLVLLGDVARVEIDSENYCTIARFKRVPAAGMAISLSKGANALDTAEAVEERMQEFSQLFPAVANYVVPYKYSPQGVTRYTGLPVMQKQGSPALGVSTGDAVAELKRLATELPTGFSIVWTGLSLKKQDSVSQAPMLFGLALAVVQAARQRFCPILIPPSRSRSGCCRWCSVVVPAQADERRSVQVSLAVLSRLPFWASFLYLCFSSSYPECSNGRLPDQAERHFGVGLVRALSHEFKSLGN